jgi:hypothetical protein
MSKIVLVVVGVISFFGFASVSERIEDVLFFTRPFDKTMFDPVLLVCADHLEILKWHELAKDHDQSAGEECTFQVDSQRQVWVESEVRKLQSPPLRKGGWIIHAKQLGGNHQQIYLGLFGDGVAGLTYEVQDDRVTPLKSLLKGRLGAIICLVVNLALWNSIWLLVWGVRKKACASCLKRI